MEENIKWLIDHHAEVIGYATEVLAGLTAVQHGMVRAVAKMKAFAASTPDTTDDAAVGFVASSVFYVGVMLETLSEVIPVARIGIKRRK